MVMSEPVGSGPDVAAIGGDAESNGGPSTAGLGATEIIPDNMHLPGVEQPERKLTRKERWAARRERKAQLRAEKAEKRAVKKALAKKRRERRKEGSGELVPQEEGAENQEAEAGAVDFWQGLGDAPPPHNEAVNQADVKAAGEPEPEPEPVREPAVFPLPDDFIDRVFEAHDDGSGSAGKHSEAMLDALGVLSDSIAEGAVLALYETHGYAIDAALWRATVHAIWEDKVAKGVPFLDPAAEIDAARYGYGLAPPTLGAVKAHSDECDFDDDDDDFITASTENIATIRRGQAQDEGGDDADKASGGAAGAGIAEGREATDGNGTASHDDSTDDDDNATTAGEPGATAAAAATIAADSARDDGEGAGTGDDEAAGAAAGVAAARDNDDDDNNNDSNSDGDASAAKPVPEAAAAPLPAPPREPTVLPTSPAEQLTQRNGGGTDWKPDKIVKSTDGTEYVPGSAAYEGAKHNVRVAPRAGTKTQQFSGMRQENEEIVEVGVIDDQSVDIVRGRRASELMAEVRIVNENQLAGPMTGVRTLVDSKSEVIARGKYAQQNAWDVKRVNPQVRGADTKVAREGADATYYGDDGRRFAEAEGVLQYRKETDEGLIAQVASRDPAHPAYVTSGGSSEFTRQMAESALVGAAEATWLLRTDTLHGRTLCLSFVHDGRVSHHFVTGGDACLKISLFPFEPREQDLEGCSTVDEALDALRAEQPFWPAPLGEVYKPPAEGEADVVVARNDARPVPVAPNAPAVRQRHAERVRREVDAVQPLTLTKGALKQTAGEGEGSKERLLGHRALERGSASPTRPVGRSGYPKKASASAAAAEAPVKRDAAYHEHGRFFHAKCNKSAADQLLAADGGLKRTGRFLVRPKGKSLILSVVFKGKVTNHAVDKGASGTYSVNGKDSGQATVPDLLKHLETKQPSIKWPVPLKPDVSVPSPEALAEDEAVEAEYKAAVEAAEQAEADAKAAAEAAAEAAAAKKAAAAATAAAAAAEAEAAAAAEQGGGANGEPPVNRDVFDSVEMQLARERAKLASIAQAPYHSGVGLRAGKGGVHGALTVDSKEMETMRERAKLASIAKAPYHSAVGVPEHVRPRNEKEAAGARIAAVASVDMIRAKRAAAAIKPHNDFTGDVRREGGHAKAGHVTRTEGPVGKAPKELDESYGRTEALTAELHKDRTPKPAPVIVGKVQHGFGDVDNGPPPKLTPPRRRRNSYDEAMALVGSVGALSVGPRPGAASSRPDDDGGNDGNGGGGGAGGGNEGRNEDEAANGDGNGDGDDAAREAEDVLGLPYAYDGLSAATASKLLAADGGLSRTGRFLVRTKKGKEGSGDVILSVVFKGKATHHTVARGAPGDPVSINGTVSPCNDVAALVEHLGQKRKELKWPVPLVEPVTK